MHTIFVDFFKVIFIIFNNKNFCKILFVICELKVSPYQVSFALSYPSWQLSQSGSGRAVFITDQVLVHRQTDMTKMVSHCSQMWGNCAEGDGRLDGVMGMPCNQLGKTSKFKALKQPPSHIQHYENKETKESF